MSAPDFSKAAGTAPQKVRFHELKAITVESAVRSCAANIKRNLSHEEQGKAKGSADKILGFFTRAKQEAGQNGISFTSVVLKFEANVSPVSLDEFKALQKIIEATIDAKLTELIPCRTPWIKPAVEAAPTEAEPASLTALMSLVVTPPTVTETTAPASVTIPEVSQEAVDLSLLRIQLAGALARAITAEGNLETLRETHAAATVEITELRQQTGGADQPLRDLLSDIMHSHANGEPVPEHIVQRVHEIDQEVYDGEISQGVEHARNFKPLAEAPHYNGTNG